MVLHLGDDDGVAGTDPEALGLRAGSCRIAHRVGHQVETFGGVLGEDDLGELRADERGDPVARRLVEVGRLLGDLVRAAVHGGVVPLVELALGVENLARLLRGGAAVEVDEPAAVAHGPREDREVRAESVGVEQPVVEHVSRPRVSGRTGGEGHDEAPAPTLTPAVLPGAPT